MQRVNLIQSPLYFLYSHPYFSRTVDLLFQEIPLVIAARLFDRPINKLGKKELNDLLHGSKDGMIGCHWIYATVAQN